MRILDVKQAETKLAEIGYYRLSGYWYPAREFLIGIDGNHITCPVSKKPLRGDNFSPVTFFTDAVELYRFDKELRLLMLDAVESLEVNIRTLIAHELGACDPMAYKDVSYINLKQTKDFTKNGKLRNIWKEWSTRQQQQLDRCKEDCIVWHRKSSRSIPFWVAVEAWDFGTVSKYFEMLKGSYQNKVLSRLGLTDARMFTRWLQEINLLRNRCAHHTRIWNQVSANPLAVPVYDPYFAGLNLSSVELTRFFGLVAIIWYLLRPTAANSLWIDEVSSLINCMPSMPGCTYAGLGLQRPGGFPRHLFNY
jgi:abortive infection bacteriophage resistance protein